MRFVFLQKRVLLLLISLQIVMKSVIQATTPPLPVTLERVGQSVIFSAEVARTSTELAQGLMGRSFLGKNQGMLFIFPQPQYVKFWMKETLISLDLIFADVTGKVIQLFEQAQPQDLTPIFSQQPIKYVLEVPGKSVQTFDIRCGDSLTF